MILGEVEGAILLGFASFCATEAEKLGKPMTEAAGPTALLGGLVCNGGLSDGAMAATVLRLVKVGARVQPAHFDAVAIAAGEHRRDFCKTMHVLHSAYYSSLANVK
jgi:hypothetical protein